MKKTVTEIAIDNNLLAAFAFVDDSLYIPNDLFNATAAANDLTGFPDVTFVVAQSAIENIANLHDLE